VAAIDLAKCLRCDLIEKMTTPDKKYFELKLRVGRGFVSGISLLIFSLAIPAFLGYLYYSGKFEFGPRIYLLLAGTPILFHLGFFKGFEYIINILLRNGKWISVDNDYVRVNRILPSGYKLSSVQKIWIHKDKNLGLFPREFLRIKFDDGKTDYILLAALTDASDAWRLIQLREDVV
jgi:hypothetical protein